MSACNIPLCNKGRDKSSTETSQVRKTNVSVSTDNREVDRVIGTSETKVSIIVLLWDKNKITLISEWLFRNY